MGLVLLTVILLNSLKAATQVIFNGKADTSGKKISLVVLPQNFYIKRLGFFCKKELEVQKALSLPVYFRLGSKEYVDRLEKKY
jgi:hypothetical protein